MQGTIVKVASVPVPSRHLTYYIRVRKLGRRRYVMDAIAPETRIVTFRRSMRIARSLKVCEEQIARAIIYGQLHDETTKTNT